MNRAAEAMLGQRAERLEGEQLDKLMQNRKEQPEKQEGADRT